MTLGLSLPAAWTGKPRSVSAWDLSVAAARQVALASARSSLGDYRDAEDASIMWNAPGTLEGAYLRAAFWTAVAARTTGRWDLQARAAYYLAQGQARSNVPGSERDEQKLASVMRGAASAVGSDDLAIHAILASAADPERVRLQQQQAEDTGLQARYARPAARSLLDLLKGPRHWPLSAQLIAGGTVLLIVLTLTAPAWRPMLRRRRRR